MRGLFLNNFYEAWNNLRIVGIFILLFGVGVIYTGSDTLMELFPYISISMFAVSGISTMRKDTVSQWNRYELTLPIKRGDLMRSKYANYLFWTLCGLLVSVIIVSITFASHRNLHDYGVRDFSSLFSLGVGLAVMAGAMFFPLAVIFGADKSEVLLTVSVLLSVALAIAALNAVNMFELSNTVRLVIFDSAYVALYAISYLISCRLYREKDF